MIKSFDDLIQKLSQVEKKKVSVAVAQDDEVLLAVKAAKERGIADSILVGDADLIKPIAEEIGMNLDEYEVIDVKDKIEACRTAVKLVHDGKADMYMKGLIDTKDFLKSVLDKEVGLRSGRPLSHVCVRTERTFYYSLYPVGRSPSHFTFGIEFTKKYTKKEATHLDHFLFHSIRLCMADYL